jgi:UDP-xylose:glucoside alpha-1,3-xylosyltransferase
MYGSNCKTAENLGAAILHGCRRVFQNDRELAFAHVYKAFQKVFFFIYIIQ